MRAHVQLSLHYCQFQDGPLHNGRGSYWCITELNRNSISPPFIPEGVFCSFTAKTVHTSSAFRVHAGQQKVINHQLLKNGRSSNVRHQSYQVPTTSHRALSSSSRATSASHSKPRNKRKALNRRDAVDHDSSGSLALTLASGAPFAALLAPTVQCTTEGIPAKTESG